MNENYWHCRNCGKDSPIDASRCPRCGEFFSKSGEYVTAKPHLSRLKKCGFAMLLFVSIGTGWLLYHFLSMAEVPDVAGLTPIEASEILMKSSFLVEEGESLNSNEIEKGRVLPLIETGEKIRKKSIVEIHVSKGKSIQVPNVVGKKAQEAAAQLDNMNLIVKTKSEYSEKYAEGEVLDQSVSVGSSLDEGGIITLTISMGSAPFQVKNYVGKQESKVKQEIIEELGLVLEIEKIYHDTVKKGEIISQIPKAGEEIRAGETFTIIVSNGREQVTVPTVTGQKESKAKEILKSSGLILGKVSQEYDSSISKGVVISQSKKAGKKVEKNTTVNLVVSLGEKPEETIRAPETTSRYSQDPTKQYQSEATKPYQPEPTKSPEADVVEDINSLPTIDGVEDINSLPTVGD